VRPVAAAGAAEVARLGRALVVVVAELGVGGAAARALERLLLRRGALAAARGGLVLSTTTLQQRIKYRQPISEHAPYLASS
jgi:hypothetical protein